MNTSGMSGISGLSGLSGITGGGGILACCNGWADLIPPVSTDFAWINQGTATIDTSGTGVFLRALAASGVDVKIRKKTLAGGAYTLTACMLFAGPEINFANVGLVLRATDQKLVVFGFGYSAGPTVFVSKYTTATDNTGGSLASLAWLPWPWLQIVWNGTTTWTFNVSMDGVRWIAVYSGDISAWLTPIEAGFFADAEQTNVDVGCQLLSWAGV